MDFSMIPIGPPPEEGPKATAAATANEPTATAPPDAASAARTSQTIAALRAENDDLWRRLAATERALARASREGGDGRSAEEALRRALAAADRRDADLAALLEAIPSAVFVGDVSGTTRLNVTALRLTGAASVDDFRERRRQLLSRMRIRRTLEGPAMRVRDMLLAKALRGEVHSEQLWVDHGTTGEPRLVQAIAAPVVSGGSIVGAVVVASDVTARHRLEEEAREADHSKSRFVAMLSHELRSTLTPIRNSLYVLDRTGSGTEKARGARAVIGRQLDHMARLVDDVLDLSRVVRGKIQLVCETLDLRDLARFAVEDHAAAFDAAGVRLELDVGDEPLPVFADRTRLAQVIGNLLDNARKFTPAGGLVRVSLERSATDGSAVLQVRDTGPGIRPETMPRLFAPFAQGDDTLHRSGGGLGLGLSLVRTLTVLHGGSASVTSEGENRGAEFTIRLPPAPPASAAREAGPQPILLRGRGPRRVLIIEDNVDSAETLREVLELGDHVVALARTGPEGIAIARHFTPELILCDIGLPGMSGYEVARAVRSDPELRAVPLVALSGYAAPEDVREARSAGFDHHLAKPPSPQQIDQILRQVAADRT
jgi:signal transduction histidine kinase/ActR/RegA family two-component response regulator